MTYPVVLTVNGKTATVATDKALIMILSETCEDDVVACVEELIVELREELEELKETETLCGRYADVIVKTRQELRQMVEKSETFKPEPELLELLEQLEKVN